VRDKLAAGGHLDSVHGKEPPLARDTLELLGAAVRKRDTRADDKALAGAGDEPLVRPGECADPRADVDGHAADVVADELALAGVQAGAHIDVERSHGVRDRSRTADPARRSVEGGEEAVAQRLHFAS